MSRKVFIAGNWKMNKTAAETVALCQGLKEKFAKDTASDIQEKCSKLF